MTFVDIKGLVVDIDLITKQCESLEKIASWSACGLVAPDAIELDHLSGLISMLQTWIALYNRQDVPDKIKEDKEYLNAE